jgi:hypothetical protein
MEAFGTLRRSSFSHDDKCFYPESAALGPIADRIGLLSTARRLVVSGCEGEGDTTIFLLAGTVAAIVSDKGHRPGGSAGRVGFGARHIGRSHSLDHAGAAGHAPNIGAIAAEGSAQPSVVGE